jgi:hypothetical protein
MAAFAAAFVGAATLVFGVASFAGAGVRALVPTPWRAGTAAASLLALAVVDVLSVRARTYCVLGMKRQARQALIRRYSVAVVAAAWGFDTGLAVTTFRVSAVTWAAFALALLGFAPWWIGVAYGVALAVPMLVLLITTMTVERLQRELGFRRLIQTASAAALAAAGAFLLVTA